MKDEKEKKIIVPRETLFKTLEKLVISKKKPKVYTYEDDYPLNEYDGFQ